MGNKSLADSMDDEVNEVTEHTFSPNIVKEINPTTLFTLR